MKNLKTLGILVAVILLLVVTLFRTFGELAQLADINPTEPNSTMAVYNATTFMIIKSIVLILGIYIVGILTYQFYKKSLVEIKMMKIKDIELNHDLESLHKTVKENVYKKAYGAAKANKIKPDNQEAYKPTQYTTDLVKEDFEDAIFERVSDSRAKVNVEDLAEPVEKETKEETEKQLENDTIKNIVKNISNLSEEDLREEERYLKLKPKKIDYIAHGDRAYDDALELWKDTLPSFMACINTIVNTHKDLQLKYVTHRVNRNTEEYNKAVASIEEFYRDYNLDRKQVIYWVNKGYGV